jgi:hypothetical protein
MATVFVGDGMDSWAVYEDDDSALIPHLIVRQLLGAHRFDERNLPAIGAIAAVDGLRRREVAATASEWERWWTSSVAAEERGIGGSREPEAPQSPHLRAFLEGRWTDVLQLTREFRRRARSARRNGEESDLTITELMTAMEARRGVASPPFRLRLGVLPFLEPGIWRVTQAHYLVSLDLRRDRSAFGAAIRPVLEELSWGSG